MFHYYLLLKKTMCVYIWIGLDGLDKMSEPLATRGDNDNPRGLLLWVRVCLGYITDNVMMVASLENNPHSPSVRWKSLVLACSY